MGKFFKNHVFLNFTLFLSAICSAFLLFSTLINLNKGIDFIDEGYYLSSIFYAFKYKFSISQFGLIYNPFFHLIDYNIYFFRQANIIVTFILAWLLSAVSLRNIYHHGLGNRLRRLVVTAALGTTSLAMLRLWLPTPSYNWLAFQALMLTGIGALLSRRSLGWISVIGWVLIGVGGWLAFMAKPTTAAVVGLLSLLYLLATRRLSIGLVAVAGLLFFGLLATTALVLDGSFGGFLERFTVGLERAGAYGMGHTISGIFRIDPLPLDWPSLRAMAVAASLSITCSFLAIAVSGALRAVAYVVCILCAILIVMLVLGFAGGPYDYGLMQQMFLAAIGAAALLFALIYNRRSCAHADSHSEYAAIFIGMLPLAFVFGTANNYWFMAGLVGFFWVLSGICFIRIHFVAERAIALTMPFVFAAQAVTANQILYGIEKPYYQPGSLRSADYLVDLGARGGTLRVAPSAGIYIEAIRQTAKDAAFQAGTPMIDLTGYSPGALYVMGASATGQPWLIGNFPMMPGSNSVAIEVLRTVSCSELSQAWLLTEPEGPFSFPPSIISVFGADQTRDFSVVGSFSKTDPLSNFKEMRTQYLLRPNRSVEAASKACESAKLNSERSGSADK